MIRRREFIAGLGGAAAWPLAARAQQGERMRRIGALMVFDETDPEGKLRYCAFTQALADLGWTDGRNVRMDLRWAGADNDRIRMLADELVGLQPDIILTSTTTPTVSVQRETRTIPIVFVNVTDPVASGIVERREHADAPHAVALLRARRERPRRRAAESSDNFAPLKANAHLALPRQPVDQAEGRGSTGDRRPGADRGSA